MYISYADESHVNHLNQRPPQSTRTSCMQTLADSAQSHKCHTHDERRATSVNEAGSRSSSVEALDARDAISHYYTRTHATLILITSVMRTCTAHSNPRTQAHARTQSDGPYDMRRRLIVCVGVSLCRQWRCFRCACMRVHMLIRSAHYINAQLACLMVCVHIIKFVHTPRTLGQRDHSAASDST